MTKYLKINGKVSKDKWQSMFRYFLHLFYEKEVYSSFVVILCSFTA